MPSELLKEFKKETCPDVSFDDPKLTAKLIESISKLKQEIEIKKPEGE